MVGRACRWRVACSNEPGCCLAVTLLPVARLSLWRGCRGDGHARVRSRRVRAEPWSALWHRLPDARVAGRSRGRRSGSVRAMPPVGSHGHPESGSLEKQVRQAGFDHGLFDLVRMRASQLNGCAYCLDMHSKDARASPANDPKSVSEIETCDPTPLGWIGQCTHFAPAICPCRPERCTTLTRAGRRDSPGARNPDMVIRVPPPDCRLVGAPPFPD